MTVKEILSTIVTLLLAGIATVCHDIKAFVHIHSFAFHVMMSVAQWLCYISSFAVGALTIYKHFKFRKYGH